jgi:hypothetical protein
MNTIIIEHADQKATNLFKQMSDLIGLKVKVKAEQKSVITNPEILKAIDDYETGRVKPLDVSIEDLKKMII